MRESGTLNRIEIASRAEVSDRDVEGWVICHRNNLGLNNRLLTAPSVARASLRHAATEVTRRLERLFDDQQRSETSPY